MIVWKLIGPHAERNAIVIGTRQNPTTTTAPFKEFLSVTDLYATEQGSNSH